MVGRTWLALALAGCGGSVGITGSTPVDPVTPVPTGVPTPDPSCVTPTVSPEGPFLARDVPVQQALPACTVATHAFAGAAGSTVALHWTGPEAVLQVTDLNGAVLEVLGVQDGDSVPFPLEWTGEHLVRVRTEGDVGGTYALTASCASGCELLYTRHPLVFLHGMAGTDAFLGQLDYWYGVRDRLEGRGYAVHVGAVDPFQPSDVRAAQWAGWIDGILTSGRARKVNLIGHSQGGIDARLVAHAHDPDHAVLSVTTISTPHRGTSVADIASGVLDDALITDVLVDAMFDAFADLYGTSDDQDIIAQLDQLSSETMAAFNASVPDRPDVAYASWAGRTCQLLDLFCQDGNGGEIVTPLFGATHLAIEVFEGDNDGLVSVQSAMWGEFLGELPADHLDEVGLFPGTTAPGWDHLGFYETEAARLSAAGL